MQFCCVIRLENIDYRSRRWGQIYLGTDAFVDDMQCKLLPDAKLREVRAVQKRQVAKPFAYYANKYSPRNTAIEKAYLSGGYSMKEIGDYFGLHYSWISRIMRELEKAKRKT
ncbi:MAG: hypothetical protein ABFS02_12220 [Pseudomonadota bacterium]